ncbi:hypothetical protein [Paenibacillus koleovorans]|uniref:hypothetical protein n=1 Tax=Paenibacillus koleovorans TaxID=121608 RepID=UPI0013E3D975|nr:hypothetical protein [Paenibacillus koleovorans]
MDREEIRAMEPKYTGNTRHLTEGEAEEIKHTDPTYGDDAESLLEHIPPVLFLGANRLQ